jgi:hypothetical protein
MHKRVRNKHNIFKKPCQFLSTNSELLPSAAYNAAILAVVRRSTFTRSSKIFLRLTASDCFFLGAICRVEQEDCHVHPNKCNYIRGGWKSLVSLYMLKSVWILVLFCEKNTLLNVSIFHKTEQDFRQPWSCIISRK